MQLSFSPFRHAFVRNQERMVLLFASMGKKFSVRLLDRLVHLLSIIKLAVQISHRHVTIICALVRVQEDYQVICRRKHLLQVSKFDFCR